MVRLPLETAAHIATVECALEAYLDMLVDSRKMDGTDEYDAEIERASDLLADLGRIAAHAE